MPRSVCSTAAAALLCAAAITGVYAHHSIAAVYDNARRIEIEGNVTEFKFVNPHPVLVVEIGGEASGRESWELEMDNRSELAAIGVTASTFRPGDHVVASGNPARRLAHRLYLLELNRPADGFRYAQVGTRPRIDRKGAPGDPGRRP